MAEPARHLSLDDLPALLAEVPTLVREVRELRAKVETIEGRRLRCPKCNSGAFRTVNTVQGTPRGTKRRKVCRGCGEKVTTYEVIE